MSKWLANGELAGMPEGAMAAYEQATVAFEVTIRELTRAHRSSEQDRARIAIQRIIAGTAILAYDIGKRGVPAGDETTQATQDMIEEGGPLNDNEQGGHDD